MRTDELSIAYGGKLAVNERLADGPPGRGARADRPLGLRQDDAAALAQPARRADPDRASRSGRILLDGEDVDALRRHPPAPPRGHGLPAAEPVPDEHLRQRRLRPARARLAGARAGRRSSRRSIDALAARRPLRRGRGQPRPSRRCASPAASSSGSASPARWPSTPRCCCSTSPARRSTRSRPRSIEELIVGLRERGRDRDRHPQPAAGPAGRRPRRLHVPRRPGRVRRRPSRSSAPRSPSAPRDYVSGGFG